LIYATSVLFLRNIWKYQMGNQNR